MQPTSYVPEVPFKNWTASDFTYMFANQSYTFKAGSVYSVPADIAQHFAKHLAIRELHNEGLDSLPELKLKDYVTKCFPDGTIDASRPSGFKEITIEDGKGVEAAPTEENKTIADVQNEDNEEDETASDDKNNAGDPKFKAAPAPVDAEYIAP